MDPFDGQCTVPIVVTRSGGEGAKEMAQELHM